MALKRKLLRLPNYLKAFGPVAGLRLGLSVGMPGGAPGDLARPFSVPGYGAPVWLRPTASDHSIFWQCMTRDQYDLGEWPQTVQFKARMATRAARGEVPVIIDGGANIGLAALNFARAFPAAHIVAVEPDADNHRVLSQNAAASGAAIMPVLGGIASRCGSLKVVGYDRGSAGLQTAWCDADDPDAIQSFDVPALVAKVPGGWPAIVKLDIEGAQDELFSANTDWVSQTDLIILELDDWQFPWSASAQTFFAALSAHKFDWLIRGELIFAYRHSAED